MTTLDQGTQPEPTEGVKAVIPRSRGGGPDPADFDFWVGRWDCLWEGGRGTNLVSKELAGRVLVERFEAIAPEPFSGMSWTAFDRRNRTWHQTWADSAGNLWTFVGGWENDRMVLTTADTEDGHTVDKRMVFFDIAESAFEWRWERSDDGGRTWQALWTIRYRRRNSGDRSGDE